MKKKTILFTSILIALALSACGKTTKPIGSSISSEDTPSSISSEKESSSSSSSKESGSSEESSSSSEKYSSIEASSSSEVSSGISSSEEPDTIVNIEIMALNDMHGNVTDSSTGLGISRTASLLEIYPNDLNNVIYISQGDMWQGSAEAGLTYGAIVNDWMNEVGFVSMTVGNHEFDWGTSHIKTNAASADFPYLGINVYSNSTHERVDYLQPSTTVEKNGAKIGIIGAIGDCYSSISSSMVQDVYFVVGSELTSLVANEATRLRNEENCDFIIYSVHDGRDDSGYNPYDVTISNYVDLVLEGHTHIDYHYQDSKGVYHVQGAGYNETINHIDVDVNVTKNTSTINAVTSVKTNNHTPMPKDPDSEALFTKYDSVIGHVNDVIGYNKSNKNSTYLHKVVASLYLSHGQNLWGEYEIFLGGGYIKARSPYNLPEGDVTYAQLYNLFPFNNDLVLCSISGYYLSQKFITQQSNYYVSYSPYGNANKDSVSNYETYYIVTDTYTSDFGPNNLTVIERYPNYYARDMLADYIRQGRFA